jgi:hypothetical protein
MLAVGVRDLLSRQWKLSQLEDVELELSTFQRPNIIELQSAFGQSSVSVIKKTRTMRILNSFDELSDKKEYDLNINTHGDLLPFTKQIFQRAIQLPIATFRRPNILSTLKMQSILS